MKAQAGSCFGFFFFGMNPMQKKTIIRIQKIQNAGLWKSWKSTRCVSGSKTTFSNTAPNRSA